MNVHAAAAALRALAAAIEEGPTDPTPDGPISAKDAAAMLGVSPSTITVAVASGHLQAARFGKRALRIMRSEVERYREARLTS